MLVPGAGGSVTGAGVNRSAGAGGNVTKVSSGMTGEFIVQTFLIAAANGGAVTGGGTGAGGAGGAATGGAFAAGKGGDLSGVLVDTGL